MKIHFTYYNKLKHYNFHITGSILEEGDINMCSCFGTTSCVFKSQTANMFTFGGAFFLGFEGICFEIQLMVHVYP